MTVQYVKAVAADYDEVIDLANYVFSAARVPHDFPAILPKLYKREYFTEAVHYLAKEDGKIRAVIGAYPLTMNILGDLLPGRGIGMVSVHPYTRSRGYMRALMEMALEDMRRDGMVFSCLGGQRQRYEYFGYTPAGTRIVFECRKANVRHVLGKDFMPGFSLRLLTAADRELVERIRSFHEAKPARLERDGERFFDIISSWGSKVYAVLEGETFAGYLICNSREDAITELNLGDPARIAELIALFLHNPGRIAQQDRVAVTVHPHETGKLAALTAFAEDYSLSSAYSFNIFNYPRILEVLLKLKARTLALADGAARIRIGGETLGIAVSGGNPSLDSSAGATPPDITLSPLEAAEFFFSPMAPLVFPAVRDNPFLRNLLPLPLFFESADEV
ncbi:MAG: GNAT family N-acetyltransferase [Treponema sp.]|jgi:predicted N-acetyltransferase YhbS|nr:GNAT family N-acetyltransferase [Treponema sp.]